VLASDLFIELTLANQEMSDANDEVQAASNGGPKPFVWRASVEAILDKIAHCKAVYETLH